MSHKRTLSLLMSCAVTLAVSQTAAVRAAQKEAIAYGVDNFSGSGECGGSGDDLSYSVEFAEVFYDVFSDWRASGAWDQATLRKNGGVDDLDWTDSSKRTWGVDSADPAGADHADVALISTHGYHVHGGDYYSAVLMGQDNTVCDVRTDNHMFFGNSSGHDLEIVILAACQTTQLDVWSNGGYDEIKPASSNLNLNTLLGFHGNSYDSRRDRNHLEDFTRSSYSNGLGDNFLDEMYRKRIGSNNDQCPTAVIWAESESRCDSVFYWGGMADRNNDGSSHSVSCFYYIDNCDPSSGERL